MVEIANFAPPITVTMTNLTIRDGGGPVSAPGISGGGIGLFGATQAHTLNLVNSTLTDNRGIVGGGMNVGNVGIANLRNVTLSANKASVDGGGLASDGTVLFTNGTVTDNAANAEGDFIGGGGGLVPTSDTIQLRNTIVSGNRDDGQGTKENECDGSGAITSLGNSLVGTMTDCTYNAGAGDVIGAVPGVTPLASNGGPVQTHALLASSAALNKGAACETTDARGLARTLGGACDIGAYERATCGTAVVNVIGTEGNDVLQGTSGADGILALGGKDTVAGLAGADGLCGGAGKDSLKGGAGKDRLLGEAGKDRLAGGTGKDRLIGGAGKDNLLGGKGKDRCKGGPGKDKQKGC